MHGTAIKKKTIIVCINIIFPVASGCFFCVNFCPPLHTRHIPHIARYAAPTQLANEVFLLIKLSLPSVRNKVCSLKMIELSKHVGAN
jgi:hypothetical protein